MQNLEMMQLQRFLPDVSRRRMADNTSTTISRAHRQKQSKELLLSFRYGIVVLRCVTLLPQAAL
jgi:hypothetical protein